MKNILLITPKYSSTAINHYLTNDLVNEMINQGHKVNVIALASDDDFRGNSSLVEHLIGIKSNLKFLKYITIWFKLYMTVLKVIFTNVRFDQVVMFAPLSVMWPAALVLRFCRAPIKTAIIFDLFPAHQLQIGALHQSVAAVAKFLECFLLNGFNDITAMGSKNKQAIEEYYSWAVKNIHVRVLPLWGAGKKHVEPVFSEKPLRFIFGGQIIKGREIPTLIEYLLALEESGLKFSFDIYSKGPAYEELKSKYGHYCWIKFKPQIPREQYFEILSTYDVGFIVTDRRVTLPTFPSKIIDYVFAGLASYCIVEKESDLTIASDLSDLIYLNNFDFSQNEITSSINFFQDLSRLNIELIKQQNIRLIDVFSVEKAVDRLVG